MELRNIRVVPLAGTRFISPAFHQELPDQGRFEKGMEQAHRVDIDLHLNGVKIKPMPFFADEEEDGTLGRSAIRSAYHWLASLEYQVASLDF